MTITLTWAATEDGIPAGSYILAQTPDPIPMTNLQVNGSRSIQEARLFRALETLFYDRGNRKTEISFETTRLQASQQAAEQFVVSHETMFPGQFLVTLYSGSGSSASNWYLINAVMESCQSRMKGCTTYHSYKISGGILSTTSS